MMWLWWCEECVCLCKCLDEDEVDPGTRSVIDLVTWRPRVVVGEEGRAELLPDMAAEVKGGFALRCACAEESGRVPRWTLLLFAFDVVLETLRECLLPCQRAEGWTWRVLSPCECGGGCCGGGRRRYAAAARARN